MDKDTKFALLIIGVPFIGLLYCAFMVGFIMLSPSAQNHPIITGTIFALVPSIISGAIWFFSSLKAKKEKGLKL